MDARLEVLASISKGTSERGVAQSAQLQQQIWSQAVAASRTDPTQNTARTRLPANNEMFDVTTERAVAFQAHLPDLVFYLLIFIALMSALLAGYSMAK